MVSYPRASPITCWLTSGARRARASLARALGARPHVIGLPEGWIITLGVGVCWKVGQYAHFLNYKRGSMFYLSTKKFSLYQESYEHFVKINLNEPYKIFLYIFTRYYRRCSAEFFVSSVFTGYNHINNLDSYNVLKWNYVKMPLGAASSENLTIPSPNIVYLCAPFLKYMRV